MKHHLLNVPRILLIKRAAVGTALFILCLWTPAEVLYGQARAALQGRRRINESIDERRIVRLTNTTHLRIRRALDNGRVSADLPMERVVLMLKSSPEQAADLEQFLAQQQDPSSPHYHEWLTPEQFAERFGASLQDIGVIVNWLQNHGLRVSGVSNGRREIEFAGTAVQIEEAFHTEIHHYELNGEMHIANAFDIATPEALAPVVEGIVSLHDFNPKPKVQFRPAANFRDGTHGLVPYDFATIYNVAPLWNQGFDGTGQTIGVVGRSNINVTDIATFRANYGLPVRDPQVIVNGTDPGIVSGNEEGEADLDVEWSGAVAKGATIKFVVSKSTKATDGIFLSSSYIVNNNVAPILSVSFVWCEAELPLTLRRAFMTLWQQAAAQGISVVVSSGDSGSAGCDDSKAKTASSGLGVNGLGSSPYNVAVGGTQFNENGADSTYWNSSNNPSDRSSAKSYIPEVVWNENGPDGLLSGGGGVSTLYSAPSWQTGLGVPTVDPGTTNQHHRYMPDVSLTAGQHDGYIVQQAGQLYVMGGTSASAPAFAGILAIISQVTNQASGNPNPRLYALAASMPTAFHDIVTGTNAVPCAAASRDCVNGTMSGFRAGPGYDLATGLGSVDAYVLAHAWATSAPPANPVSITSSSSLTAGSTGTAYTLTLAASGGTPPYRWTVTTGALPPGLTLSTGGVLSGTPAASGTFSFTLQVTDSSGSTVSQSLKITIVIPTSTSSSSSATASTYHVFPEFADGRLGDGTYYRTTLMVSNPSATAGANCTLQLRQLTVPGFGLNYAMGPNGSVIASTAGTQDFQSGYATLQCTANVEAQLLYSYYLSNGTKISEATVFSSPPGATVRVLADEREGAQLGLAIANDSDQTVTYTVSVSGASRATTVTLGPRTSIAKFASQFVSSIPANNLGQVQVSSSNGTASVIGLRFTGPIFTTIPESIQGSPLATASTYHVFPQFSDGKFSDGTYYRTTRIYINPGSSSTADCTTRLRGVTVDGNSGFTVSLAPGSFVVAPTNGTQSLQSGYATMQCSSRVDAQALYSYYSANGTKLSEATVFSSPSAKTVQILADSREGAQVGLAIANDSDQRNTYTISVGDANGNLVGSATQTLEPRTSIAKFISQFVTLPPNHYGQVIVTSDTGTASVIGLRYTGNVFTTIPETIRP